MSAATEPGRLDGVRIVRGASRGFTVLAIGGVIQPLVGAVAPAVGYVWLVIVAVVAFVVAAAAATDNVRPARDGALAALASYLLVVPVVLMAAGSLPADQLVYTSATALITGALTNVVRVRLQSRGH